MNCRTPEVHPVLASKFVASLCIVSDSHKILLLLAATLEANGLRRTD